MASAHSPEKRFSFVHASQVPILPGDIIAQICQQIFATPLHQYNLSLSGGSHSQWYKELKFRTSLPLVSKVWWKPATRGLYNHIIIRRLHQIPYLARTLSSKDAGINFGALVRKITLYECLVVWPDWNVRSNSLRTVFEQCVGLEELSFHRHPDGEDATAKGDAQLWFGSCSWTNPLWIFPKIVFPALLARGPTTLRTLDLASLNCWDEKELEVPLHQFIRACPRLTSLALRVYHPHSRKLPVLDALEELYLDFHGQAPNPASKAAVWMWDLPRLRSLTVVNVPDGLPTVLERLGRALTYLHLCCATPLTGTEAEEFARIPVLCPALEHLVFYPAWQTHSPADDVCALLEAAAAPFLRLRYLDLWLTRTVKTTIITANVDTNTNLNMNTNANIITITDIAIDAHTNTNHIDMNAETEEETEVWTPDDTASLIAMARTRGVAPSLETARALLVAPSGSGPPALHDLPTICHPALLAAETRFACVRDVWMTQTAWCVRPVGDWWLSAAMWLADESGGYCSEDAKWDEFYNTYEADWLSSSSEEEEGGSRRVLRRLRRREDSEDEEGSSTMETRDEGE